MRLAARALAAALVPLAATAIASTVAPQSASAATATYRLSYGTLPNGVVRVQRWNPCQATITYKVNVAAVPSTKRSTVLSETKSAVAKLASATRMTFSYKGTTTEVPRKGTAGAQTAELVIAWTSPTRTDYPLSGSTIGYGGFSWAWASRTVSGKTTYTYATRRGFVVLDTPQAMSQLASGFGYGARRGNLVLHEIGHAVGLQHVSDPAQLMYPALTRKAPNGYAAGDRAGLSRLGRNAGCLSTTGLPYRDLS
jgi:hypothetical protein